MKNSSQYIIKTKRDNERQPYSEETGGVQGRGEERKGRKYEKSNGKLKNFERREVKTIDYEYFVVCSFKP